ncbi:hypothetical protein GJAV_G00143080 [Gymnothorax javanicus]|nr:hypothetical protein GJAV_G00143080 [Gymnothorax javanicus]
MNCQDGARQTALHLACEKGDLDCVRELLQEYGASTDVRNHNGDTAFHCAAKQDSAAIIQELCSRPCAGVNELNDAGETPLHVACRFGKVQSLKALLESGAKCDVIGGKAYAIHTAMKYSRRSCAEAILEADPAQLQSEDPMYGGTPLHWAKTAEMTKILLEKGSSVNFRSRTGESPLHIHTKKRRFDSVIDLLSRGAKVNLRGLHGNTALHYAMKMDHMEMIKALIVFGADVEIANDLGETPGMIAAQKSKEHLDIVRVALSSKVETEPRTEVGEGDDSNAGSERVDRLLSLDGGGIRGLILIEILTVLEREARRPLKELFDWISGTSTGGILALGIVHGKSMEYLRRLYFRLKGDVFKGSIYDNSRSLEKLLKREFGEDTNMHDVKHPRVIVTSVLADRHPPELHLFRNYAHPFKGVPRHAPTFHSASTATLSRPIIPWDKCWPCMRFEIEDEVFNWSFPYDSDLLENFLKERFKENTKMTDVKHPRVTVTSVLADGDPPNLPLFRNYDPHPPTEDPANAPSAPTATFRTSTTPREHRVWYAARATSAAPIYFRSMDHFLDGGLLANNPTLDSMAEIHRYNKALHSQGRGSEAQRLGVVVSLGTGKIPQSKVPSVDIFRPKGFWQTLEMIQRVDDMLTVLLNTLTMSDSCVAERARSWCEMTDTSYHRSVPGWLNRLPYTITTEHTLHYCPTLHLRSSQ